MALTDEFMRIPRYWISCTNPDLITNFNNLEDALQSLKDKYNAGFKDYGVVKHREHYELRKYHPQPYKNRSWQKANERSDRTRTIGNIKLYYHPKDEEERQAIKSEIGLFTVNKNYTADKMGGHHITWLYIGF
tara:strand:+ start:251 stop:649 length:399 start_codon:yes stop_codon:yes gene_type:complete